MGTFEVTRSASIAADPGRLHELIDDFHQWTQWSPWEALDPEMQRTYSGPSAGKGARYAWQGNRKAGEGSMEITGIGPDGVDIERELYLSALVDRATSRVAFVASAAGGMDIEKVAHDTPDQHQVVPRVGHGSYSGSRISSVARMPW